MIQLNLKPAIIAWPLTSDEVKKINAHEALLVLEVNHVPTIKRIKCIQYTTSLSHKFKMKFTINSILFIFFGERKQINWWVKENDQWHNGLMKWSYRDQPEADNLPFLLYQSHNLHLINQQQVTDLIREFVATFLAFEHLFPSSFML